MPLTIALLGLFHESNTFCEDLTQLEHFYNGHILKGEAIKDEYRFAFHEIGGMLEVLEAEKDVAIVPVLYAEATPGGMVSAEAYSFLLNELLTGLAAAMPVDACLVVPHGAAVCESCADMDGHWLAAVREQVGENTPIVGTLDPHANVSRQMIDATNGLIAYRTNPHVDQRETGKKAARLLLQMLRSNSRLKQTLFQVPLAISIEQQHTAVEPCRGLFHYAQTFERQEGIVSISLLLGFPYADVNEMGTSVIVVSDVKKEITPDPGLLLKDYLLANCELFTGPKQTVKEAVASLSHCKKPVLLLDMGDNIGGGAPGNSVCLLKALEEQGQYTGFISLYDPASVAVALHFNSGDTFTLTMGKSKLFPKGYTCQVKLLSVSNGKFKELHPRHGGQVNYNMGITAVVRTLRGSTVMLTSLRVPPFSLQQMTAFGLYPENFDIIIAKGVNAPIAAYGPVCAQVLQVDTPGVTRADMTAFNYQYRRKPMFPFERLCQ